MIRPFNSRKVVTRDSLAALAVALAPLAYFYPATLGALVISPDDGVIFNVPLRAAAARIMLSGSVPLWNPYIFSGMPLHGAAQGGLLFPPNWFYLAFSVPVATNLMMLASYSLAALGAFLYARRSGASLTGATLTSLVWQWSAFLVCQIGHTNVVQTAAMLPWVLWAIDGYGATGRRSRGVVLAALVALQCFAGHQQTFAYSLLLASAYAFVMARSNVETRAGYYRSLLMLGAGVLLSAAQILPTFELLRNSLRADASYDFFTSFSMPRRFVLTLFAPFLSGGGSGELFRAPYVGPSFYGEYAAYVGSATLVLAALALLLRRDARTKFWAVVAFVCLLLALGRYAPLGFYKLIYYVPVLNLFRVPARHLMEVEFALAVLAGRGLTVIASMRGEARVVRRAAIVGACVFLLTCIAVTWGRPDEFKLGRQAAEVSLLRAPELFLPVAFAALGAFAVWRFARARPRGASLMLLAVLTLDLLVWGQSSGWRASSPTFDFELWGEPETVRYLRERETQTGGEPFRILTEDQPFDPDHAVATLPAGARWLPSLQPDVYMMHGIENAAGYDGFGLARYSRLAGDMKVWGELTDAERTLRGESRELDLLNVRYLLTRPLAGAGVKTPDASNAPSSSANASSNDAPTSSVSAPPSSTSATLSTSSAPPAPQDFPEASQAFGGYGFASQDLGLPSVGAGARLSFVVPPIEADRFALVTNLAWSVAAPDGASVARVRLEAVGGKSFDFELRAGEQTSEWAFDRADIRAEIKHRRAPVATSYSVEDTQGSYEAHSYVASFALPERSVIKGGEIEVLRVARAPELTLSVLRASLLDEAGGKAFPLRREWLKKESAQAASQPTSQPSSKAASKPSVQSSGRSSDHSLKSSPGNSLPSESSQAPATKTQETDGATPPRWRRLARLGDVAVYENARALPRAWLATDALALGEDEMLGVIRTGRLADGSEWNPLRTALVEAPFDFKQADGVDANARAEVSRREANRIEVKTDSAAPSILVLSENHYPGWRAYVDGRAAETMRVNYNLRGVALAAGAHTVEFVYRPKSVFIGFALSLLTLAALLVWAARKREARRPLAADAGRERDD